MLRQEEIKKTERERKESRDRIQKAIINLAKERGKALKELEELNKQLPLALALTHLQVVTKEYLVEFKAKRKELREFTLEDYSLTQKGLVMLRDNGYIVDDNPDGDQPGDKPGSDKKAQSIGAARMN